MYCREKECHRLAEPGSPYCDRHEVDKVFGRVPLVDPKLKEILKPVGSKRFHELLEEIGALHDSKQADYGKDSDPFANVRASNEWGVAPWIGAMVRLNDKVKRLQTLARKGVLQNESAKDSMKDIAVYALIALVLYEQGEPQAQEAKEHA